LSDEVEIGLAGISNFGVGCRVARFFLLHDTKTVKNVQNEYKMYQMVMKYPKLPNIIPNGHKMYKHFII
jgi:hypothetical protein